MAAKKTETAPATSTPTTETADKPKRGRPSGPPTKEVRARLSETAYQALDAKLAAAHWPSVEVFLRAVGAGAIEVPTATIASLSCALRA